MNFKGTLPTLILQALAEQPSHGYRIAQQIKARSKGVLDFKEGTLSFKEKRKTRFTGN